MGMKGRSRSILTGQQNPVPRLPIVYERYRHAILFPSAKQLLGKYVRRPKRVIPTRNQDNICRCFLYPNFCPLNRLGIGVQTLLKERSIRNKLIPIAAFPSRNCRYEFDGRPFQRP